MVDILMSEQPRGFIFLFGIFSQYLKFCLILKLYKRDLKCGVTFVWL